MLCKTTQNISSHEIYTHAFIMFHHIKLCVKPTITTLIHHCYHWVGSSAVLLFTAAVLLLMLAALGQSAPAQDQLDVEAMVEKVLSTKALSIQYSHGQSCQILSSSLVVKDYYPQQVAQPQQCLYPYVIVMIYDSVVQGFSACHLVL